LTQQNTQSDTDKYRQHLHLLQFLLRVTHNIGNGINRRRAPNQIEDVPELQAGVAAGYQLNPARFRREITTS
jgi:hypothetical protein